MLSIVMHGLTAAGVFTVLVSTYCGVIRLGAKYIIGLAYNLFFESLRLPDSLHSCVGHTGVNK